MATKNCLRAIKRIVEGSVTPKGFENIFRKVKVVDGGHGKCVCELDVTEDFQNRFGALHGGVIATLVDSVSTWALMSTDRAVSGVSVDMNISYLKGAKVGEPIVIDAKTLKCGRTLAFLSVDIKNKNGDLLAHGKHTKFVGAG